MGQTRGVPAASPDGPVRLCALLWAVPGRQDELSAYEDDVLRILADHGGTVLARERRTPTLGEHDEGGAGRDGDLHAPPDEVHVLAVPTPAALDAFRADPRRAALDSRREAAVARSLVFEVAPS
jgi:uncharacterized protein (DUF1330 family)